MKRLSLILGALVLGALCTHAASADTFSFSFTGSDFNGSGTFDANSLGGNEYKITSAGGKIDGSSISLLGVNNFMGNDNLLFVPGFSELSQGPFNFDSSGASFLLANGGNVNISQDNFGFYLYDSAVLDPATGRDKQESIDLTVTDTTVSAVPEPGSLALFSTGILGLAGVLRRKLAA